jgi:triosephosphate isomerase
MNKIVIANWKNYLPKDIEHFLENVSKNITISPPATHILQILNNQISVAAQDSSFGETLTGSISPQMLKDLSVDMCIVGHPERRNLLNETRDIVYKKIMSLIEYEIIPILCTEDLFIREDIDFLEYLDVKKNDIILAYEPSEFIGGSLTIDREELLKVIFEIKESLDINVLYGGGINSSNAKSLADIVDGFLIGKASLDLNEINLISKIVNDSKII